MLIASSFVAFVGVVIFSCIQRFARWLIVKGGNGERRWLFEFIHAVADEERENREPNRDEGDAVFSFERTREAIHKAVQDAALLEGSERAKRINQLRLRWHPGVVPQPAASLILWLICTSVLFSSGILCNIYWILNPVYIYIYIYIYRFHGDLSGTLANKNHRSAPIYAPVGIYACITSHKRTHDFIILEITPRLECSYLKTIVCITCFIKLLCWLRYFWKNAPFCITLSFVFLGNAVFA